MQRRFQKHISVAQGFSFPFVFINRLPVLWFSSAAYYILLCNGACTSVSSSQERKMRFGVVTRSWFLYISFPCFADEQIDKVGKSLGQNISQTLIQTYQTWVLTIQLHETNLDKHWSNVPLNNISDANLERWVPSTIHQTIGRRKGTKGWSRVCGWVVRILS